TDQQQQQQQSAARRTTKRTAKAKTAAAVLDNRLLIEGWVERSETHQKLRDERCPTTRQVFTICTV
ncbi:MAG: hypothetical protein Q8J93_13500, partial [Xanthomonadales bacterium]|nr:hypothetical protein [Xanthomonadales bacterium]